MGQEIELKLDLAPQAAADFLASDLAASEPFILERRATYFDTPDADLRAAGFSLRIRNDAQGRVQIVKAVGASAASLFARPKWEQNVEGDKPVLDDTTPLKTFLGRRAEALEPLFEVVVERRRWSLAWEDARIEVALDRGDIVVGERRTPVCEIELELVEGPPSALFSYARTLDRVAPLRLGVLSKAERGYRLLGAAVRAVKAEPVALTPDMSVPGAFRIIADGCLKQFRLNEMLLEGGGEEAVHQARVALRRLRSALWVFKAVLEDDAFGHMKDELKWLAGALGEVRDLDVLIRRCKDEALRKVLADARETAFRAAAADLESPRARALMLDFADWLACGAWHGLVSARETREQPVSEFAASALDRLRRKVKKGGRDLVDLDDDARHEVRKDAKKLRYAAEFFGSLFDRKRQKRRHGRFLAALEPLQDQLGALNDAAAMPELLARLGLADDARKAFPSNAIDSRRDVIKAAADAHDALVDTKRFWR
ncbi:MAG: CYTH and CHAD domain-containing protein [Shinella sp.]|uniref:CYTH and CHAD domain-containing protein n=1 Tax=Shinella sp. TaxID=1870904 RepID=UPI0040361FA1